MSFLLINKKIKSFKFKPFRIHRVKPIWRKLNALASYTAPEYDGSTIGLKGPWMRMTVGDLIYQQPMFISSLYYTLVDSDTTWETNIEKDPANMEVPKKIQVSLGATLVTDYLPQKGGRMYTLAKQFGDNAVPARGTDNWLSDMGTNETLEKERIATNVGYVVSLGPDAYADKDRYPGGAWCKEGDWVIFGRYAGARIKIEGGDLRLLNDDDVLAVISDPEDVVSS